MPTATRSTRVLDPSRSGGDPTPPERTPKLGWMTEALEIDPFPRKPGVAFEFTPPAQEESPFAVLKKLKDPGS